MSTQTKEALKEKVKANIERYHQDHYYECYPAGAIRDWVYDAVLENIVIPMQAEIDSLKANKIVKQPNAV